MNLDNLSNNNYKSHILQLIATNERVARIDIANKMHVSKMLVSNIVNELIDQKLVIENINLESESGITNTESKKGRRPKWLDFTKDKLLACGLYISREYIECSIADIHCTPLFSRRSYLEANDNNYSLIEKSINLIHEMMVTLADLTQELNFRPLILGIGVASIGPINKETGLIIDPPNFFGIKNVPIVSVLQNEFHLPVFLDNDMNSSAIAENLYGVGKKNHNFIFVGISSGIGAGIVIDNALFEGSRGFAGELGHTSIDCNGKLCSCGNRGCLELYACTPVLIQKAIEQGFLGEGTTFFDIVAEASKGNAGCQSIMDDFCSKLSFSLATIGNLFDPESIIIGHDAAVIDYFNLRKLDIMTNDKILSRTSEWIPVITSTFGERSFIYGSVSLVFNKLFNGSLDIPPQ